MRPVCVVCLALFVCLPVPASDVDLALTGRVVSDADAPLACEQEGQIGETDP